MLHQNRGSIFNTIFRAAVLVLLLMACRSADARSQWVQDDQMKFKIQVPSDYQRNRVVDGTDIVHAFLSPDQNVAVRIRAIRLNGNVSIDTIIQLFEQNIIVGAQKLLDDKYVLNKIPGKICGYKWKYNNIPVGLAAFYTIRNDIAYIVWSIVPEQMFKQRTPETDAIINTFTLFGGKTSANSQSATIKPKAKEDKAAKLTKKQEKTIKVAEPKQEKTADLPGQKTAASFFDLVSDDAGITHKVPTGFKQTEKEAGQTIWQNDAGIKMVVQTITRQGEFKSYINGLVSDIKEQGATVISNVLTVENGLTVANYVYQYGESFFAYGATEGTGVYYLVGFVGKTKDKDLLTSYSEEANMSLKKAK